MALKLTRKQQLVLLSSFITTDKAFRTAFLNDPQAGAQQLDIKLTKREIDDVKRFKKSIRDASEVGEAVLGTAGFDTTFFPFNTLE